MVRRNDVVTVIAGRDAVGKKTGKVLHVIPGNGRAIVEGINLVKKCLRKTQEHPQGGIGEKEASIAVSNLMLFCPRCKKGVKARKNRSSGKTVRECKLCGHAFD